MMQKQKPATEWLCSGVSHWGLLASKWHYLKGREEGTK